MANTGIGKVFVGLSGGVDSAVSAALLKQEGYEVTGVFIRISLPGYPCSAGEDKIDAMRVAAHLKIPFVEIDLSNEYKNEVFANTIAEFAKGRTPNPDTLCNQKIKFGHFYDFAMSHGADFVATGHYARTDSSLLLKSVDEQKDQSYFLWMVPEEHLRKTLFPVGGLTKPQVRALAKEYGLPNAGRKDSQGLCFLGRTSIEEMLERELVPKPGSVIDESGTTIGSHQGVSFYTLGQRHGFEISTHAHSTAPHFIIDKKIEQNVLIASTSSVPPHATGTKVHLANTNWIGQVKDGGYKARYRYRAALILAVLDVAQNIVTLKQAHYLPLGQSLVLYDGDRCLGGGIIEKSSII